MCCLSAHEVSRCTWKPILGLDKAVGKHRWLQPAVQLCPTGAAQLDALATKETFPKFVTVSNSMERKAVFLIRINAIGDACRNV